MGALQVNYRMYVDVRNENKGRIVAKQNDTKTRYLDITVTDNGVPVDLTGCEVRIYGRKYDNKEFYNDGILQDAAFGRCLFEATTQMLAYPGQNVHCEIVVFKDNVQILSTMPFDIFVVESLMGENAIESSNEYGALVVLFQNLYEAHDLMTTMVESFGESGETAASVPATTFWQMLEAVYRVNADALENSSVQSVLEKIGSSADVNDSTLFGKLKKIFDSLNNVKERIYIPSDTVRCVVVENLDLVACGSSGGAIKLNEPVYIDKDGFIKVVVNVTLQYATNSATSITLFTFRIGSSTSAVHDTSMTYNNTRMVLNLPVGTSLGSGTANATQRTSTNCDISVNNTLTTHNKEFAMRVHKGDMLCFNYDVVASEYKKFVVNYIKLCFDEQ